MSNTLLQYREVCGQRTTGLTWDFKGEKWILCCKLHHYKPLSGHTVVSCNIIDPHYSLEHRTLSSDDTDSRNDTRVIRGVFRPPVTLKLFFFVPDSADS